MNGGPILETRSQRVTDDAFLGGALAILQPKSGYRAGVDAVLLAAAVPCAAGRAIDVGAGVGTAGLCLARRCTQMSVALFERETELIGLARENVDRNGLAQRVTVAEGDIGDASDEELRALGIAAGTFDHVLANPPFHVEGDGTAAFDRLKAAAHAMPEAGLETVEPFSRARGKAWRNGDDHPQGGSARRSARRIGKAVWRAQSTSHSRAGRRAGNPRDHSGGQGKQGAARDRARIRAARCERRLQLQG